MFKIDETKIDLSAQVICVDGETETLEAQAPTSKVFFDKLSKLQKEQEKTYGKNDVPIGVLNAAALVVVYGRDIDWYRARFTDDTLQRLNKFLVAELLEAKKK